MLCGKSAAHNQNIITLAGREVVASSVTSVEYQRPVLSNTKTGVRLGRHGLRFLPSMPAFEERELWVNRQEDTLRDDNSPL
jgi:hypothetical protein